jgi:uncharacterized protein (DUF885 family)
LRYISITRCLRDFHRVLLEDGPLPLDLLEKKMTSWMESARGAD